MVGETLGITKRVFLVYGNDFSLSLLLIIEDQLPSTGFLFPRTGTR